jgi:hypothetical protein
MAFTKSERTKEKGQKDQREMFRARTENKARPAGGFPIE